MRPDEKIQIEKKLSLPVVRAQVKLKIQFLTTSTLSVANMDARCRWRPDGCECIIRADILAIV
jgi:hypothetical protein